MISNESTFLPPHLPVVVVSATGVLGWSGSVGEKPRPSSSNQPVSNFRAILSENHLERQLKMLRQALCTVLAKRHALHCPSASLRERRLVAANAAVISATSNEVIESMEQPGEVRCASKQSIATLLPHHVAAQDGCAQPLHLLFRDRFRATRVHCFGTVASAGSCVALMTPSVT